MDAKGNIHVNIEEKLHTWVNILHTWVESCLTLQHDSNKASDDSSSPQNSHMWTSNKDHLIRHWAFYVEFQ